MAVIAIHPGEHLAEELDALDMSAAELARKLRVPTNRVTQILNGSAQHYRRHSAAPCSFLRDQRAVLAQSAEPVRSAPSRRKGGQVHQDAADAEAPRIRIRLKLREPNPACLKQRTL